MKIAASVLLAQAIMFILLYWLFAKLKLLLISADSLTLLLTTSAIVMTATAVVMATVVLFNFRGLRKEAREAAREEARSVLLDVAREFQEAGRNPLAAEHGSGKGETVASKSPAKDTR